MRASDNFGPYLIHGEDSMNDEIDGIGDNATSSLAAPAFGSDVVARTLRGGTFPS